MHLPTTKQWINEQFSQAHSGQILSFAGTCGRIELFGRVKQPHRSTKMSARRDGAVNRCRHQSLRRAFSDYDYCTPCIRKNWTLCYFIVSLLWLLYELHENFQKYIGGAACCEYGINVCDLLTILCVNCVNSSSFVTDLLQEWQRPPLLKTSV